nr:hypothetical protein Iba_scaffold12836CG0010 [Ipomoea batatas]GME17991.1 hypothetical protein Iba_scaffold19743CG0260 [Ipomoea batatas]
MVMIMKRRQQSLVAAGFLQDSSRDALPSRQRRKHRRGIAKHLFSKSTKNMTHLTNCHANICRTETPVSSTVTTVAIRQRRLAAVHSLFFLAVILDEVKAEPPLCAARLEVFEATCSLLHVDDQPPILRIIPLHLPRKFRRYRRRVPLCRNLPPLPPTAAA